MGPVRGAYPGSMKNTTAFLVLASLVLASAAFAGTPRRYTADDIYPVRVCGWIHVREDQLTISTRLSGADVDIAIKPYRIPVHAGPFGEVNFAVAQDQKELAEKVKLDERARRGCAYSARLPFGAPPVFYAEEVVVKDR